MALCTGLVMGAVMALNQIPAGEIAYGMGLCLFLLLIAIAADYWKFYRKCRRLKALEADVTVSLSGLEPPEDRLEEAYYNLLALLMEDKINKQNEMGQKARDYNEYFAMWVHQIKTPISALRLLLQEQNGTEELNELFRIEQYVEMALQYMRLDSETTDFLLRRAQLDLVIREAVHKYARLFIRKKIKLNYSGVDAVVLTDEKWIGFVIGQILSNAIQYTSGGSISIYMDNDIEKKNVLAIEDTGIGIRAEDLPRVFEKGYTGYNGHASQRSTGIGLYLCSKIMKKLSHGIRIESEEGKGTKVVIIFPEDSSQE